MKKIISSIHTFLKELFDPNGGVSSKITVGFGAFLLLAVDHIVQWCGGKGVNIELIYVDAGIIAACFGLNTILSSKSIAVKSDVASTVAEQQPEPDTAEDVKDILNSNNP